MLQKITTRSAFLTLSLLLAVAQFNLNAHAADLDMSDPFNVAMAGRHFNYTHTQIEELAGGKEQLIERLLQLRHVDSPSFVAVRAEKILLKYADDENVAEALQQDVENPDLKGLARTIALNLDRAPTSVSRQRLARAVLARASREASFSKFARHLRSSADIEVSRLAREALGSE